ncbi:ATP-binding cassette glutathione S-conjugate transporter YCF1 Ecym_4265 [Eremothecium cymbalariae DBVPG|uniref:Metal resistance protein YCF1 n=1 Tax=Eremothecium cymbalariae (strain CBS 270.75 / DBVPG 7215 / KCTC 17166 / NRRL Y-17582) TaxID=931890 RepID=G8JTH6_ERECY|nr:hypothetical protein Ecym_4265 [Eremothecium cymbalariae DBVPG\
MDHHSDFSWCGDGQGFWPISFYYDLTLCFIDGVLLNLTSLLMLVGGSWRLYTLVERPHPGIKYRWNWLLVSRIGMVLLFLFFNILSAAMSAKLQLKWSSSSQFSLTIISLLVCLCLEWVSYMRSKVSDGLLIFFWLFQTLFQGCKVINYLIRHSYENRWPVSKDMFILLLFQMITAFFVLSLESLFKKSVMPYQEIMEYRLGRKRNPVDSTNILERLSFTWMTALMKIGYEKYLTEDDLYRLPESFQAKAVSQELNKHWETEIKTKAKPSLIWALFRSFGTKIILSMVFKVAHDLLAYTQPQLLKLLIKFVYDYSTAVSNDTTLEDLPIIRGFMLAIAMFLVGVVQTTVIQQYFALAFDSGMHVSSSMTSMVYQKSLKLSNEASQTSMTGDIVNLMSVDVQRLQDLSQWGHLIWSGPFQIILCLFSLYKLLGPCMWAGVFIMVITIPLNSLIMGIQKKLQGVQMKNKDKRTRIISEILNNIKSLKLYAWEQPYKAKLDYVRNEKELKNLVKIGITNTISVFQFSVVPFMVSCATFGTFVLTQKDKALSTDLIFPALALFNLLSFPLGFIPMAATSFIEASVSIKRLHSFLTSGEIQRDAIQHLPKVEEIGDISVNISGDATYLWQRQPEYKVALKNINFQARKGELSCIVGKVGTGKSALIQAMLGDLFRVKGSATLHGSVAYVSQVSWIMNGTIKDNILFGYKYDAEFYEKTIKACALSLDLNTLPDGDQTFVGERGISLSGGQKARLALARAVYAKADVYFLDDPLAAVDEHVSKHLVKYVIGPTGLLKTKTRILTTNKIHVLSVADSITLLDNGVIVQQGSYDQVNSNKDSPLFKLIANFGKQKSQAIENNEDTVAEVKTSSSSSPLVQEDIIDWSKSASKDMNKFTDVGSIRRASAATLESAGFILDTENDSKKEHREKGKVNWNIYMEYLRACSPAHVALLIFLIVLSAFLTLMGDVWLKHWSEVNTRLGRNSDIWKYLGIYFLLCFSASLSTLLRSITLCMFCTIKASARLHDAMAKAVLRAPMSFFETTPVGRILNRFSNDIYKVDELLGRSFSQFFIHVTKVVFTMIVICSITWQFIFFILPLSVLYLFYQQYYLRTSRELRRLASVTKSPVYAHFQETLTGVTTVRSFKKQDRFIHINQSRINTYMCAYYLSINANRWLAFRLEFMGSIVILAAAVLSVFRLKQGKLTAGMLGLGLSYALQITQSLNWIVRMTVEVETNIVSVERIKEYTDLKPEAPMIIPTSRPPKNWPANGDIKFEHFSTRYRPELDLILEDINLHIHPREKVGIVGRTGAGKSSLTVSLFRLIEAAAGRILIDDLPIDSIGLNDLRSSLSIIPQDSEVFEGTFRENIDPCNKFTDDEIWNALELAHLKQHVMTLGTEGLNTSLKEGGSNLSVGQRQLMCLARALLVPSKILVLDEATAAIDVETDKLIQRTIRTAFKDRTILTIAHRLNTIMDSDKIVVLDKGRIAEFDTPCNLLKDETSIFYSLCNEAGLTE